MEQLHAAFLDLQKECLDTDPRQGRGRDATTGACGRGVCVCVWRVQVAGTLLGAGSHRAQGAALTGEAARAAQGVA